MTTISTQPDYIPLAMINALAYCPRRFSYEFVQGEMLLNEHVVANVQEYIGPGTNRSWGLARGLGDDKIADIP